MLQNVQALRQDLDLGPQDARFRQRLAAGAAPAFSAAASPRQASGAATQASARAAGRFLYFFVHVAYHTWDTNSRRRIV